MSHIKINKGPHLRITGIPSEEIRNAKIPTSLSIQPKEFKSIKPKLMVKEGDSVSIGSPLFFDKNNPNIKWASPGCGEVKEIKFGPRRVIENIIIELAKEEEAVIQESFEASAIKSLGREKVLQCILDGHLFPMIRQRPFNKIANPDQAPDAIFISAVNTAPLSVNLEIAMKDRLSSFQAGIDALSQLTEGKMFLTTKKYSIFSDMQHCEINTISELHPAGNVGIQIHHISPLKPKKIIWTVDVNHVAILGDLFLTGSYQPAMIASVAGPGVLNPSHVKTRIGASISSLLDNQLADGNSRIISGDVLTGSHSSLNEFLGYYDSSISVLSESDEREFLGWLKPGSGKTRYSLTRAFFGQGKQAFPFSTILNGGKRALVPVDAWENVLPMDIMPIALFRSILACDIEEMEQLGMIECDPEDFALCAFACPSKIELSAVIQQGLDILEAEG